MQFKVSPAANMPSGSSVEIPKHMRAWTHTRSGPPTAVLSLSTIPVPALPTETSVLIRVSHASLHPGAAIMIHLVPVLFRKSPAVAETDFSGVVVAVGSKVPVSLPLSVEEGGSESGRCFPVGTPVFGTVPVGSHLGAAQGALAEYVAVDVGMIARKPSDMPFDQAAALAVSGATAMDVFDAAKLQFSSRCLINASCGGIGHLVVQLTRDAVGTNGHIVGICSEANAATARELGCDETADYKPSTTGETLQQHLAKDHAVDSETAFDAIIDAHGSQELWLAAPTFLKPGNEHPYATVGPKFMAYSMVGMLNAVAKMIGNSATPVWLGGVPRAYSQVASFVDTARLERLRELVEKGQLRVIIGSKWDMDGAPKAYEKMQSGHGTGKIVIKVWEPEMKSTEDMT
ncbi:GroES-like protein [Eremomyces bilateralis CBS 781.70]|uniref:GroES-like protein n=1 Tax=Eremomyces bilateralis CBS 781.70 TaxID=1392243 RepID=A0A6G1FT28_9PEZI|nr:GroES-like protein [Eremomyces bilateralis CBS 781.70]KAF1808947.1 GroES-like protein [Eremomyces bilateralis CBS 781.70]